VLRWLTCLSTTLVLAPSSAFAGVADLVAQVSEAGLVAHVEALEGDRSTAPGQAAAAEYIRGELESFGYAVASQPVAGSENLIATLVGTTHPGHEFVLGAHFDTVPGTPGADDDASGVAAVLEAARILAQEPVRITVHFVFFALEEAGIEGSEAYAASLAAVGSNVVGMISLDMIGFTCATPGCQIVVPDVPGCLESDATSDVGDFIAVGANTASIALLEAFLAAAALYEPALPIGPITVEGNGTCFPASRRSDHKSFWDEGYPALVFSDGAESRNPHYHQPSDTLETLDTDFMTKVTRAVLAHVASTALAAPTLPVLSPAATAALALVLLAVGARCSRGTRRRHP
jgi:Zn-dependent M28 family amino/carboxypeptidase